MDLKELFSEVTKIKDSYNDKLQIRIEPGRYIVGESGILLCRITARKQTTSEKQEDTRIFYGTNTGFTHLLRPALYKSHHEIFNLTGSTLPKEKAYICGNICESTDNLGNNIEISGEIGDILCIKNTGAYGFCMSSNYNERLRPAEVLINKEG